MPLSASEPGDVPTVLHAVLHHVEASPEPVALRYHAAGGATVELSRHGLIAHAAALAERLRDARPARGADRAHAVIALPNGVDYVVAFLACGLAGVTAVTFMPPSLRTAGASRAYAERLSRLVEDADPSLLLTTADLAADLREGPLAPLGVGRRCVVVEGLASEPAPAIGDLRLPRPDDLALLQYTSGSTSAPKGVMVTHANLAANTRAIAAMLGSRPEDGFCGWLPLFHDMGLIGMVLHPLRVGMSIDALSPTTFLRSPATYLEVLSRSRAALTVAPNFGWELVLQRLTPTVEAAIDLGAVRSLMSGAEPVDPVVLEQLAKRLGPLGLDPRAIRPVYGLAENTLCATADALDREPRTFEVDATALGTAGEARAPTGDRGTTLVGCGGDVAGTVTRVVDPESQRPLPEGRVGEVWITGDSVAAGYWQRPEATHAVFDARLPNDPRSYLRTGDLGVKLDGSLCLVGRRKDVIIRNGVNHAPQDLERTAQRSHPLLRPGGGVAVAVGSGPGGGSERVVVVHELSRYGASADLDPVITAMRRSVLEEHGVQLDEVRLVRRGQVPRTTSGKLRRADMRRQLEAHEAPEAVASWSRRSTPEVAS